MSESRDSTNKENQFEKFLNALSQKINKADIIFSNSEIAQYSKNVTGYKRNINAIVCANSVDDIQFIISIANQYKVILYPISQGKNWGLGSKLPVGQNNIILDLSKMNRIVEVNTEFGYAIVEPGVTQQQLAGYLEDHKIPYFSDVTGSGCETSIVGNTLERGIAYNSLRVENCLGMEIITGTGELLTTGFGHYNNALANNLYKYGIGPDMMGLFFQSSLGVVTRLAIKLCPIMPCRKMFVFSINNEKNLMSFFAVIKLLKSYNLCQSIIHVANRKRSTISVSPLIKNFCKTNNINMSDEALNVFVENQIKGTWSAIGSVMGTKKQVKTMQYELKQQLSHCGKLRFYDVNQIDNILKLLKIFNCKKQYMLLSSIKPLLGLTIGKPTNAALHSVVWPNHEQLPDSNNPDHSTSGIIFCLPIIPLKPTQIQDSLNIINQTAAQFKFDPAITLNILSEFVVEAVVSLNFNRDDEYETTRAHQCIKYLNETLMQSGYYPYRMDINNMALLHQDNSHWHAVKKLKAVFDPNNIISVGRYIPAD